MIKAVGTYFETPNEEYTIKIYVDNVAVYTQTGKSTYGGFETIKLNKQIAVSEGHNFSIEIQAKAIPLLEDTRLHFENGKSIIYYSDNTIDDLGKIGKTACIKAYTIKNNNPSEKGNTQYYSTDNITINFNAHDDEKITIANKDGKTLGSATVKEGKASFNFTLEPGLYVIIAPTDEEDILEVFEIMNSIEIEENIKIGYNIPLNIESVFYDEDGVELYDSDIKIILDGKNFTQSIDNIEGILYLTLNDLAIGTHTLVLQNPETEEESITTIEVVSRFSENSNINMYYGDGSNFKVRVYDDNGNPTGANQIVSITLNKVTYEVATNNDGYAIFNIPDTVKPGTYTLTATYAGQTIKNTVKIIPVLKLAKINVKKSAKKLAISATLKGKTPIANKKLIFKFNGKQYIAKTNKKGIAKITIKKSVLKKLKIGKKVTYQVTYLKTTLKQSVKVKK